MKMCFKKSSAESCFFFFLSCCNILYRQFAEVSMIIAIFHITVGILKFNFSCIFVSSLDSDSCQFKKKNPRIEWKTGY